MDWSPVQGGLHLLSLVDRLQPQHHPAGVEREQMDGLKEVMMLKVVGNKILSQFCLKSRRALVKVELTPTREREAYAVSRLQPSSNSVRT